MSDCQVMKCPDVPTESCGNSDRILVFTYQCSGPYIPNYQGCIDPNATSLPYCNTQLSYEARVADLISRLTLAQKIAIIAPQPELGNTCEVHAAGVPEIGLPPYSYLVETNTGVASACISEEKCVTTFNGPLGMAASFNRTNWFLKGSVLGTEMRALRNLAWHRGDVDDLIGLTGYGPNINIARDPRFGRNSELAGEDPFLSGTYAANMVSGMQQKDSKGYPKMLAYLKHFTAYSRETNRGHDTYNISMHDLWETYLAQYEIAFIEGQATGAMCR
jgi:beta-glucosidase-like glycosyl hydrolase